MKAMSVFAIQPHNADSALRVLRHFLPTSKIAATAGALATHLTVANRSGHAMVGVFVPQEEATPSPEDQMGVSAVVFEAPSAEALLGYRLLSTLGRGRVMLVSEFYVLPGPQAEAHRAELLQWARHEARMQRCSLLQFDGFGLPIALETAAALAEHGFEGAGDRWIFSPQNES